MSGSVFEWCYINKLALHLYVLVCFVLSYMLLHVVIIVVLIQIKLFHYYYHYYCYYNIIIITMDTLTNDSSE